MNSEDRKTLIEERIRNAFSPTYLEVIDESHKHVGHAGYLGGNRHFAIIIRAECFNGLTRVAAHRCIYSLFNDIMPDDIHALRINIV